MPGADRSAARRPRTDRVIADIADYVFDHEIDSDNAYVAARYALMDTLGCALLALEYPACTKLLGPVVPGAGMPGGARVPGISFELDPVQAAFNLGTMARWLDFNDTWLAAEWGHPSDNLGAILSVADYVTRKRVAAGEAPLRMRDVLTAMIKAYEIQGVLALDNAFNCVGLDHVILVRVASAAVATHLLGGSRDDIVNAVSNAWADGGSLRVYRHAPNTGSRKSWAAGDATSRGVRLGLLAVAGEMGYPTVLSAERWGFYDVLFQGAPFGVVRAYDSYVIEQILFKPSFPAEFHAQSAAEAALRLHPEVVDRLAEIERVAIKTQESGARIIDKSGPLHNPADRDHCLQYIVAIALIFGEITAGHYEDDVASDPRIDRLRERARVTAVPRFSRDYLDPDKRSIANAVQVWFKDGGSTDRIEVEFPLGHPSRRTEALPVLRRKFQTSVGTRLPEQQVRAVTDLLGDQPGLEATPVDEFMDLFSADERAEG